MNRRVVVRRAKFMDQKMGGKYKDWDSKEESEAEPGASRGEFGGYI